MPKKANITNEEVETAATRADDLVYDLMGMAEEIRAGRCDDLAKAVEFGRKFTSLARVAADVANAILVRKEMSDMRTDLEANLRARVANGE
jgi:hypothetical protein